MYLTESQTWNRRSTLQSHNTLTPKSQDSAKWWKQQLHRFNLSPASASVTKPQTQDDKVHCTIHTQVNAVTFSHWHGIGMVTNMCVCVCVYIYIYIRIQGNDIILINSILTGRALLQFDFHRKSTTPTTAAALSPSSDPSLPSFRLCHTSLRHQGEILSTILIAIGKY